MIGHWAGFGNQIMIKIQIMVVKKKYLILGSLVCLLIIYKSCCYFSQNYYWGNRLNSIRQTRGLLPYDNSWKVVEHSTNFILYAPNDLNQWNHLRKLVNFDWQNNLISEHDYFATESGICIDVDFYKTIDSSTYSYRLKIDKDSTFRKKLTRKEFLDTINYYGLKVK
jgi:hypothetical protein